MSLFELLKTGKVLVGKIAMLKKDIKLNNGQYRTKGSVVSVLIDKGNGKYHIEDGDFACEVSEEEIKFIDL